jgi:hypothetical protein
MPSAQAPHHSPAVLILIDIMNHFEFPNGEKALRRPKKRVQSAGMSTVNLNDNFGQWRSDVSKLLDYCVRPEATGKAFVEQALSGLTTNSCIICAAHDAKMREFELYVPSDCSAARTAKEHRQASRNNKRHGA